MYAIKTRDIVVIKVSITRFNFLALVLFKLSKDISDCQDYIYLLK